MTAKEVLETVATLPQEDWTKIQCGIADLITSRFSPDEIADIRTALAEAEAGYGRDEGFSSGEVRKQLGLL